MVTRHDHGDPKDENAQGHKARHKPKSKYDLRDIDKTTKGNGHKQDHQDSAAHSRKTDDQNHHGHDANPERGGKGNGNGEGHDHEDDRKKGGPGDHDTEEEIGRLWDTVTLG